jgi:hypothetical protein
VRARTALIAALCISACALALTARLRASARATGTSASLGRTGAQQASASPVRELVSAVAFRVATPFVHEWRKEKPLVASGYLLVLSVDPELVRPRETAEPVLYCGDETVERVNHGYDSGRVVAIVPAPSDADGRITLDLSEAPFWFGAEDLPERVDAREIRVQHERAEASLVRRFTRAEVAAALARGGETMSLARREDLEARAGLLVLEHSPEEHDLADGLLVPSGK